MRSSRLVAESLRVLSLPGAVSPPPLACPDRCRDNSLAWQPARIEGPVPACLLASQHDSWRRAVAAVRIFGGAILAEPVGSGKSWVALAAASEFAGRATVIGPAALRSQWLALAPRTGVSIQWHSHELASRGTPPRSQAGFVIIDEAHRLRHLDTRRVRCIAPWLAGRPTLLLTATPIVNRRSDLVALLRLFLPDDALRLDGLTSLRTLESARIPPPSLRRVVIRSSGTGSSVKVSNRRIKVSDGEAVRGAALAAATLPLTLGTDAGVRALVLSVLLEAAASSDAAWQAMLRRYQALLLQSRDAGGISRAALRRFAGRALDQLLLWSLLPASDAEGAPPLSDLPLVEQLLQQPSRDGSWLEPLEILLRDRQPTICFTRHRATAIAAIRHLGEATAWITGDAAGIGPHRLRREQVLAAFGPGRGAWRLFRSTPTVLVTTEVGSEGLDLQGASRVVHLDIPWHASRMEQRTGRVARIGQQAGAVEMVERLPPPALERLLGMRRRVRHKGRLATRWLEALDRVGRSPAVPVHGTMVHMAPALHSAIAAVLVGVESAEHAGTIAMQFRDHAWEAMDHWEVPAGSTDAIPAVQAEIFRLAGSAAWQALQACAPVGVSRPRLQGRLIALARSARERRDFRLVERIDRLLQAAGRPGPLGTEQLLTSLADAGDDVLLGARIPAPPRQYPARVAWMVLVIYRTP